MRVAVFLLLVRQTLTHPPPLPGLGTGYVETTQESLPVNIDGVTKTKYIEWPLLQKPNILSDKVTRIISLRGANTNLTCSKCRVFFLVCHVLQSLWWPYRSKTNMRGKNHTKICQSTWNTKSTYGDGTLSWRVIWITHRKAREAYIGRRLVSLQGQKK
jgi:hypothetical protein